jgi:hypothetical protein
VKDSDFDRAAARAISRLRNIRDEIELAQRAPGEFVTVSRKAAEAIDDDVGVIGRYIRKMAEGRDE